MVGDGFGGACVGAGTCMVLQRGLAERGRAAATILRFYTGRQQVRESHMSVVHWFPSAVA